MGVSFSPELPSSPAAPPPAAVSPSPSLDQGLQGELRIDSGPDVGHTYRIGSTALRLGRSPDNELILRDPATSGHHARLERRATSFYIIDLGSTNGTLVNGEPVQEKELKHGDRITIGQNAVSFTLL
jgi:pSer/pThr/pTyr-binding forkhead associated (FHA) protein